MSDGKPPEVHIMIDFMQAQSRLPRELQAKTAKLILQLKADPSGKGINFEPVVGARDKHMRSARVDKAYRAIVYDRGNALILLWVDKHDDAYRWAQDRVVEINQATASVQVSDLKLVEDARAQAAKEPPEAAPAARLFADVADADLVRLGVPEALLPAVRTYASDGDLEAAKAGIPPDAYDALVCLAAGYTVAETADQLERGKPTPVTEDDFAAALKTDESRRTFWLVEDDDDLRRMLDAPLDFWRVFLHPSQRKLVERSWNGPVVVRGGAGTGKTVVAMHRARWLADMLAKRKDATGKVLFTTFTTNLALDIQESLGNLCSKEQLARIEVQHLDGWVGEFLKREGYVKEIVYGGEGGKLDEAWSQAYDAFGEGIGLSLDFLKDEWRQIVQANALTDVQGYMRAQRTGRGTPISMKTKQRVWTIFAAYRAKLDQEGWAEPDDAYRDACAILKDKAATLPYRAVVVDEVQDMGAEAYRLLSAIAPGRKNDHDPDSLFLVGDAHQRIYGRKASVSKCGIEITGRSRKLKVCYRTSDEIRRWAVAVLQGMPVDDLDNDSDDLKGYRSLFHGPAPDIHFEKTEKAEADALAKWIEDCKEAGVHESDICVLARTKEVRDKLAVALKDRNYQVVILQPRKADERKKPGVRAATMHRAKGLEFTAVALIHMNEGLVPPKWLLDEAPDAAIRRTLIDGEKSLVHVSATRAKKRLFVGSSGQPSELLRQLEGAKAN